MARSSFSSESLGKIRAEPYRCPRAVSNRLSLGILFLLLLLLLLVLESNLLEYEYE